MLYEYDVLRVALREIVVVSKAKVSPPVSVALQPPSGWFDKTMLVFSAPIGPDETMAANIVVSRDALGSGEDFAAYCVRQEQTFAASLPGYELLLRQDGAFGDRDALRIELEWLSAAGKLRQIVTLIDAGAGAVVSFAGSGAPEQLDANRAVFEDALQRLVISKTG